ncbi:FAD-dependent oxidoreductase [Stieleria mannarensis]|uniref:FAD-dependent oxidoreductase n=1 Tax=Stieleria mannarensis TaxID=2755585 RepID=UPI001600A21F|nr:FAD-dependent oxidoreductase [Rhodopirellula sp. JC639]
MPLQRREMLFGTAAVLGSANALAVSAEADSKAPGSGHAPHSITEPQRQTPIAGRSDVLVCGGGPAGVSAAIAAARAGASVQLLECHGCLGGVWTSGMLSYVIDADKPGFNKELIRRLDQANNQYGHVPLRPRTWLSYMYDVETMKWVLETLVSELRIGVQLHTRVVAVDLDPNNRIRGVMTESKSGRQAWMADVVIDATGDGDVGALAGCEFEIGDSAGADDCPCQPMSLMGVISAPPELLHQYTRAGSSDGKHKDRFRAEIERGGYKPSYTKPTVFHMGGSIASVMMNHEYGVRPDDAAAITEATFRARNELNQIVRGLQTLPEWKDLRLVATAEQIGVRDGRRIQGRSRVTQDDVVAGRKDPQSVCTSGFCVDIHALKKTDGGYGNRGIRAKPFDIPMGALVAAGVDNLMMAGRCISGDFIAHSSYRVTGNAVAMGEYAGVAAATASKSQTAPHTVAYQNVDQTVQAIRKENS